MQKGGEKLFSVGELAGKVGVSVRTLQYYDRCGLLIPQYSEGGRRMYNREDLIRLQQIMFLKSFSFSLKDIRDRLLPAKSTEEINSILMRQRSVLLGQISYLQEVVEMIGSILAEAKANEEISIEKFTAIMEMMRQRNPFSTFIHYFGSDQIDNFIRRFENTDYDAEFTRQTENIYAEMIELYRKGVDPEGPEGQNLVARWWEIISDFTQGDTALLKVLITAGTDVDNWPDKAEEFKQATKVFLERAFTVYFKNNGIILPE